MDRFDSMAVFVATVDKGSLSAAAEAFGMSAPMAGKHIRHLEERLGARLLTRTTRRQSLTEIGQAYLEQCRQILEQVRAAESCTQALRASPRGKLRINAPVTFGSLMLAPALTHFLEQNPEVQVELTLNDRVIDLVEERVDVAIRIGALADSGLVARPLKPYGVVICAAPQYLQRHGTPRHPEDLVDHQCLGFTHWSRRGGWTLGRTDTPPRGWPVSRFQSNNGLALRMAALEGFGIVMQSSAMLAGDLAAGRLVELLSEHLPPPLPMHLIYPKDRQPVPKLSRFVEFVLARFGV
ncbi:MAG: LysR family transcriptional regulator [Rhodoferax sp.]|nr:LysR family transcriptional regulator [Rhodoferax sp.]MDP3650815.1 LysR family transcriptional regulator [Rhodoferax sp.]